MSISINKFGTTPDGKDVQIVKITNKNGVTAQIVTYGAALQALYAPDKNNHFDDIVLSYDKLDGFINDDKFYGATIGRCANRIEHGKFTIDGVTYNVAINDGNNHLHGGIKGFNKVVWDIKAYDDNSVTLHYLSVDGEEGYPGNLSVSVKYDLSDDNALSIHYDAETDKSTVVNLTNHSYFNLGGHSSGSILDEELYLNSDIFTPANDEAIPSGELRKVDNTAMDFRTAKKIGQDIDSTEEQIIFGKGYDHNWMLNAKGDISVLSAELTDKKSGRVLQMYTDSPAVQVYSANYLDGSVCCKENVRYNAREAICLETQAVPNAINNNSFETTLLKPGERYSYTTIYKMSVLK